MSREMHCKIKLVHTIFILICYVEMGWNQLPLLLTMSKKCNIFISIIPPIKKFSKYILYDNLNSCKKLT